MERHSNELVRQVAVWKEHCLGLAREIEAALLKGVESHRRCLLFLSPLHRGHTFMTNRY